MLQKNLQRTHATSCSWYIDWVVLKKKKWTWKTMFISVLKLERKSHYGHWNVCCTKWMAYWLPRKRTMKMSLHVDIPFWKSGGNRHEWKAGVWWDVGFKTWKSSTSPQWVMTENEYREDTTKIRTDGVASIVLKVNKNISLVILNIT